MPDYGLKVSLPGYNVKTAAANQLSLSSSINMLKVSAQGQTTVASNNTVTIAHGLGYIPNFFILAENTPGSGTYYYVISDRSNLKLLVYADSTNLGIKARSSPSGTYHIYYYIFIDSM